MIFVVVVVVVVGGSCSCNDSNNFSVLGRGIRNTCVCDVVE